MREEVGLSRGEEEARVEAAVGDEVDGVGVLDADESGHGVSPGVVPTVKVRWRVRRVVGRFLRMLPIK